MLFRSLGCAAENLSLAAAAGGFAGEFSFDSAKSSGLLFSFREGKKIIPPLHAVITQRQSTRNIYDGKIVPASDLALLFDAAKIPGVDVVLINDRPKIDRLRDIVISANTVQMSNAAYLRELKSWLRYNPHEALTKGDGLYSATSGSPNLPDWL